MTELDEIEVCPECGSERLRLWADAHVWKNGMYGDWEVIEPFDLTRLTCEDCNFEMDR